MVDTGHATRGGRRNSWGWGGLSAFIVACLLWTGPAGAQVPTVTAIERLDASPTAASTVRWLVRFSEDVSGVDANDFCLNTAGLSGAAIVRAADPLGAALAPNGITYATNHPGLNAHRSPAAELAAGLTVEAWIRSDTALGTQTVVSTQHSGGSAGWSFQVVDGALRFVAHGAHTSDSSAGVIVAGRWQHVAVVFDAAHTAHFYVDGLAAGAVGQSSAVQPTGQGRVFVGSRFVNQSFASTQTAVDPFAGLVDEVRVWSVERTPAELDAARWLPLAGTETGLIGYWPFDGDFDDRSPNGAALHGPFRSEAAILAYETNRAMTLVTAALRTGDGEVGLRVCDDGSIVDADANPLGGAGAGNGEAVGPVYEVERGSVVPVTYVVNTLNDENDGVATGSISLRDALAAAQTATAPVVIDLTQQVGVIDIASNGMLPGILEGTWVEVVGPGASALEVSGDLAGSTGPRLLFVDGGYLSVSGLGLRGGLGKGGHGSKSAGGGAGIGGALFLNRGHVAATAVAFSQNRAIGGNGGGMTDPTTTAVRMGGGGGLGGDGQPGFDGTSFAEITDPATLAAIQDCGQRDDYFAGGVGGDGSPLLDESPGIPVLDVRVLADPPVDVITPWLLYGFCGHRSGEGAGGVGLRDDRISRSGSSRDPGFYGGRPGGIFGGGGGGSDHNSLTISQGNTDANMAGAGGYGGGGGAWMFIDAQGRKREGFGGRYGGDGSGAPRNTGGGGGGAGLGGAVFVRQGAQLVCRQCAFSGNSAAGGAGGGPSNQPGQGKGGALFVMHNGAAKLIDAAFNGNSAANDLATATDNDDSLVEGSLVLARTAPLADAGADQLVNEGALVTLDGSGSFDSDGEPLCFAWQQVGGPPVTLALTSPAQPTFTAPAVPVGGATLTFRLTVTDPAGVEHADTVDITIKNVNNVPVADAGDDQTVAEGTLVTLDGSGSFDSDGELLGYQWAQTAGSPVALSNATAITPTFTAPLVGVAGETLTFQLTVDDGIDSASDTVSVFVEDVNHPPVANAGEDRTVSEGTLVGLDGSASTDPDGDTPAYSWRQVPGTTVVLANATTATPSFTAPAQSPGAQDTLIFEVTVSDGRGGSATDEVSITVRDLNAPPDCSRATASPLSLWPPNHKMVPVQITGVTDPEDPVRLTISAVRQDEPTNGLGDGDSAPDAAINPDGSFLLRAERSGKGDGRVYHVSFVASDGFGGECTGAVRVCVPHSARRACGDGGALYDSTQP